MQDLINLDAAKTYVNTQVSITAASASNYVDTSLAAADSDMKQYAVNQDVSTLVAAKNYANGQVRELLDGRVFG